MSSTPNVDAALVLTFATAGILFIGLMAYDAGRTTGRETTERVYKTIIEKRVEDYKELRSECIKRGFAEWKVTDVSGNTEFVWIVTAEKK